MKSALWILTDGFLSPLYSTSRLRTTMHLSINTTHALIFFSNHLFMHVAFQLVLAASLVFIVLNCQEATTDTVKEKLHEKCIFVSTTKQKSLGQDHSVA